MATEEECLLMLLLNRRRKRKLNKSRQWYVRPLNVSRDLDGEFSSLVLKMREMDEERHFQYFRMTSSKFDVLLKKVIPYLTPECANHRFPIKASQKLAVCLRFLATGVSHQALAASYKLGTTTVCEIVSEVCLAIWDALAEEFVRFPSQDEWVTIAERFWRMWNFPLCVGAIDGKHVRIRAPSRSGSDYHNYKGYFSIVLMAACDAQYRFTYVDVGSYGRESDGGIFSRSAFGEDLVDGNLKLPAPALLPGTQTPSPYVFLGDEAFPLQVNMMRPYPGTNLPDKKRVYNYRQARARRVVENAFGIMAARFRIFSRPIDTKPEKAVWIVKACVALHNFLTISEDGRYIPSGLLDVQSISGVDQLGEWRRLVEGDQNLVDGPREPVDRASRRALLVREQYAEFFLSPPGRLPYQDRVLRRGCINTAAPNANQ